MHRVTLSYYYIHTSKKILGVRKILYQNFHHLLCTFIQRFVVLLEIYYLKGVHYFFDISLLIKTNVQKHIQYHFYM